MIFFINYCQRLHKIILQETKTRPKREERWNEMDKEGEGGVVCFALEVELADAHATDLLTD